MGLQRPPRVLLLVTLFTICSVGAAAKLSAGEPLNLVNWFKSSVLGEDTGVCKDCGSVHDGHTKCIEVVPVEQEVTGKKKVFKCDVKYEWVSIPETRYHFHKRLVRKEIPCPYCKPICVTTECKDTHVSPEWTVEELGLPGKDKAVSELHCKTDVVTKETVEHKECQHAKGETTIVAHVWECVKEPYTVYRQVKRPVCVKQPRYEHVKVVVTKNVCIHCDGIGCGHCHDKK